MNVLKATLVCIAAGIVATSLIACGPDGSSSNQSTSVPSPQVGETWYIMDHAYTDEVYADIQSSGVDKPPAQTTDDNPDRSFHLNHPYPCKVTDSHDDGFYKCDVDSENSLDVKTVWTNRLLSKDQAEAIAPGSVVHKTAAAPKGLPAWLRLKPGLKLYTGYDGGDATKVTVCANKSDYQNIGDGTNAGCGQRAPGIKVHVVEIADNYSGGDGTTNIPEIKIAADDGKWAGWTGSMVSVTPRIPAGTIMKTEHESNAPAKIWQNKSDSYFKSGIELASDTSIEIIKQDPLDPANFDLYVKVISGSHSGLTGWTLSNGLTVGGESLILTQ